MVLGLFVCPKACWECSFPEEASAPWFLPHQSLLPLRGLTRAQDLSFLGKILKAAVTKTSALRRWPLTPPVLLLLSYPCVLEFAEGHIAGFLPPCSPSEGNMVIRASGRGTPHFPPGLSVTPACDVFQAKGEAPPHTQLCPPQSVVPGASVFITLGKKI
jgi:hypothetical protein